MRLHRYDSFRPCLTIITLAVSALLFRAGSKRRVVIPSDSLVEVIPRYFGQESATSVTDRLSASLPGMLPPSSLALRFSAVPRFPTDAGTSPKDRDALRPGGKSKIQSSAPKAENPIIP